LVRSERPQVINRRLDDSRIVLQVPDRHIATAAQQPANALATTLGTRAAAVIVIDM
jgi:hypothetical protein